LPDEDVHGEEMGVVVLVLVLVLVGVSELLTDTYSTLPHKVTDTDKSTKYGVGLESNQQS
jgi:hypothetical protein